MNRYYYMIWMVIFSTILIIAGFVILNMAYSDMALSLSIIRQCGGIESNQGLLKQEIGILNDRQKALQGQLNKLSQMEQPNLESFSKIANQFNLRLTGLNLKGKSAKEAKENKGYFLTYSGDFANALKALNYVENNLLVIIDAMSLTPDEKNGNITNLNLQVSIPK
ncbi:MAG: hypothetical protein NTV06_02175 [candidate division Zixibacteria bacterium]|nr:hypothetical protein [candidate division Zixibacteria bacterium]